MLRSIFIVTISVLNLAPVEEAYQNELGYETVDRGVIEASLAEAWGAPAMTGKEYVLMQPNSGADVSLRFVVNPATAGHQAMTTHGWNATELLVSDPDMLAEQLSESAFKVIGPPADLWEAPNAPRAMQAIGPGKELLYLTRNRDFNYSGYVDRTFIVVLGGPSMDAMSAFYRDKLGLKVTAATPFKIDVVASAQQVSPDTEYPLAIAYVSDEFLLELDQYPASVPLRPIKDGYLPPGLAMVSFLTDDLDTLDLEWRAPPTTQSSAPYDGDRVAVTVGAAGEWIELIEVSSAARQ